MAKVPSWKIFKNLSLLNLHIWSQKQLFHILGSGRQRRLLRPKRVPDGVRAAAPGGHLQRDRQSLHLQSGFQVGANLGVGHRCQAVRLVSEKAFPLLVRMVPKQVSKCFPLFNNLAVQEREEKSGF